MELRFSSAFAAMPSRAKLAFYTAIVFALLLVLAGNGFAATPTPSAASLKGTYTFNLIEAKDASWQNSKKCPVNGVTNTYTFSSSATYTQMIGGTAKFDGAGHVLLEFTIVNDELNQAASNATLTIACTKTGANPTNSGYAVFEAPSSTEQASGTYKVASTGSGSMTIETPAGSGGTNTVVISLNLAGYGSTGIASTALMSAPDGGHKQYLQTGIAVLQ
jgi:hypothetical protein